LSLLAKKESSESHVVSVMSMYMRDKSLLCVSFSVSVSMGFAPSLARVQRDSVITNETPLSLNGCVSPRAPACLSACLTMDRTLQCIRAVGRKQVAGCWQNTFASFIHWCRFNASGRIQVSTLSWCMTYEHSNKISAEFTALNSCLDDNSTL